MSRPRQTHGPHLQSPEGAAGPYQKLTAMDGGDTLAAIRAATRFRGMEATRERQQTRFEKLGKPGLLANGDMGPAEVQTYCRLDDA
ncbi:MAG: hypothetical protein ACK2UO_02595 [Caldilineaceae bacterium]|jgi:hypothetical protein